nr:aminodeoxychorismate/anthranilate synthase component II [Thalassobacillus devorans]
MVVIIDNYDSFTYNLVQYFRQMDEQVLVYRNNQVTVKELQRLGPDLIVLSPGPGRPEDTLGNQVILDTFHALIPILGVCLGHQAIVTYFGGNVVKGARPVHGKVSKIIHDYHGAFRNLPSPSLVTRYHSLVAERNTMPESLMVTAETEDGVVMGVRHKKYPIEGLQFHPESILSETGLQMLENVYRNAKCWTMRSIQEEV